MKDFLKYALMAGGGLVAFNWWQGQQGEPAPAGNGNGGGVQPGVEPGQSPSSGGSNGSGGSTNSPPAAAPNVSGVTALQLSSQLGQSQANFWEWNFAMAALNANWARPAAQPFFPGLSDEQISNKQISAGEYIAMLQAAGWV